MEVINAVNLLTAHASRFWKLCIAKEEGGVNEYDTQGRSRNDA